MKYTKIIIAVALSSLFFSSCEKDYDAGGTVTEQLAGEWWVTYAVGGSAVLEHAPVITYNTANDNNELWVDDHGIWPMKVRATTDVGSLTFSGTDLSNEYDETISVTILEGKVLKDAGRSRTGVVTDSIYMRVEFSDDPGNTWEISGHQRTGFLEDEY